MKRKIKEAILAFRIERAYTKERILELYLKSNLFRSRNLWNSSSKFRIF